MQTDTFSLMAARLTPLMTGAAPADDAARAAIGLLRRWDFHMDRDKVEPLLFTAWLREFSRAVLFGRLGEAAADFWDLKPQVMEAVLTRRPDWCEDPRRPGAETCATRLAAALDNGLAGLRRAYGADMTQWRWGRAHAARFDNPVFSRIGIMRDWVDAQIPTSGGYDTLDRGPSTIRDDGQPFAQRFGAGLRIVTDLAAPRQSQMMIAPGQSGNPLSAHFADLMRPWRNFARLTPGRAAAVATLTLAPER